jgi:hypothetical protein
MIGLGCCMRDGLKTVPYRGTVDRPLPWDCGLSPTVGLWTVPYRGTVDCPLPWDCGLSPTVGLWTVPYRGTVDRPPTVDDCSVDDSGAKSAG